MIFHILDQSHLFQIHNFQTRNHLFLYDFQSKETSVAAILKRGFMMDTLQKGNFSRLQIQLTDQILKIWSTNPVFVNKYKQERHHFFIALESDRGPERIRAIEKFAEAKAEVGI